MTNTNVILSYTERPNLPDGSPVIGVEQKLVAEVARLEERLEAARDDLRRWRMSHGGVGG